MPTIVIATRITLGGHDTCGCYLGFIPLLQEGGFFMGFPRVFIAVPVKRDILLPYLINFLQAF